jgi:hypothetical protein
MILAIFIVRIIFANPQSLPQANLQQQNAQRIYVICVTVQALWVCMLGRVLVVVKFEATDVCLF